MKKLLALLIFAAFAPASFAGTSYSYRVFAPGLMTPPAPVGQVALSAPSLDFATQYLNTSSAVKKVTLTNDGNATLNVSSVALSAGAGGYSVSDNCSAALAPGGTCEISVTFMPTQAGSFSRDIVVTSNAVAVTSLIALTGIGAPPPGPAGTLAKIASGQVGGIVLNAENELLVLNGRYVSRMSATGAGLGTVFSGPSTSNFDKPSACFSLNNDALYAVAIDKSNGKIFLGASCTNSAGNSNGAIFQVFNGTYATAVGAWGASGNNNWIKALSAASGRLYADSASNAGINLQAQLTQAGGVTNLGNNYYTSNLVLNESDSGIYTMWSNGAVRKYVGSTWTQVGTGGHGDATDSRLSQDGNGYLYYMGAAKTSLTKINASTGATERTWPLSGITGTLTGLQVTTAGTPFISTSAGVWRMD